MTTLTFRPGRLLKLADFLDTVPPKKFDFGDIVREKKNDCGTVCCAIGWMPAAFPKQIKWARGLLGPELDVVFKNYKGHKEERPADFEVAMKFFGITMEEAEWLFLPNPLRRPEFLSELSFDALPQEVARNIRKFVAWKKEQA